MKKYFSLLAFLCFLLLSFSLDAKKDSNKAAWVARQLHDPQSSYVLVASHRGDWRSWPENSLPAFQSAIDMGVDILELDIHKTKDGILMVCHDGTIDRTTTGKGKISDLTCQEIKNEYLRAGHGIKTDVKMPTLAEALVLCKDKIIVNIDKGYDYYDDILAITDSLGVTDQILLKGSMPKDVVDARFAGYTHNMMYLPVASLDSESGKSLLESYLTSGDTQLAYEICWTTKTQTLAEETARRIKAAGSKVYVNSLWPSLDGGYCDDAAYYDPDKAYGKLLEMGATIIQSDRPAQLIRWLHKKHRHKASGKQ